ncbi:MAG: GNAT family N-acetyltransferase [Candidatus Contendobacter sp.]|nr:GNAT family N-acetyltransferase [Candidatus Contendobacter sp.]
MQIEPVCAGDREALFQLFTRCFGLAPQRETWQWKYDAGAGVGVVAHDRGELVAHYGALIRRVLFQGEHGQALAPMDVMVAPEQRGVLSKQNGLMAQTARYLFQQQFGEGKPCRLAMGFPTRRARALGARLGLYIDVSVVDELSWSSRPLNWYERLQYRITPLRDGDLDAWVNPAWRAMAADFHEMVIGVRDSVWVRYRYLQHPARNYLVLGIQNRWGTHRLGVVVVREDEDSGLECLDLIAPRSTMPELVKVLRHYCSQLSRIRLHLWVNRLLREPLMSAEVEVLDRDMRLTVTVGPNSEYYARRWWITNGDTDFR